MAVVLRDRGGDQFQGLLVAGHGRMDEGIAHLSTFWVPNAPWLRTSGVDEILAAGWLTLVRGLAAGGAVGVTAGETWSGPDFIDVLHRIAGFRPAAEVDAERGLSPADSTAVLVEWRATVEDQRVVQFCQSFGECSRPRLDGVHRGQPGVDPARHQDPTRATHPIGERPNVNCVRPRRFEGWFQGVRAISR